MTPALLIAALWIAFAGSHLALSRMASNSGDFTNATKEMTQAISGAPDQTKPFLQPLLKRLEAKDDINK